MKKLLILINITSVNSLGKEMEVVSFSVDKETKADIEQQALTEKRSKSDIFREMYTTYKFNKTLDKVQAVGRIKAMALGLETVDDVESYLSSTK